MAFICMCIFTNTEDVTIYIDNYCSHHPLFTETVCVFGGFFFLNKTFVDTYFIECYRAVLPVLGQWAESPEELSKQYKCLSPCSEVLVPEVAVTLESSEANPDDQRGFRSYATDENKEKCLSVL